MSCSFLFLLVLFCFTGFCVTVTMRTPPFHPCVPIVRHKWIQWSGVNVDARLAAHICNYFMGLNRMSEVNQGGYSIWSCSWQEQALSLSLSHTLANPQPFLLIELWFTTREENISPLLFPHSRLTEMSLFEIRTGHLVTGGLLPECFQSDGKCYCITVPPSGSRFFLLQNTAH